MSSTYERARIRAKDLLEDIDAMETESSVLKREVEELRKELKKMRNTDLGKVMSELEETKFFSGKYACALTKLANEKIKLKARIDELEQSLAIQEELSNGFAELATERTRESIRNCIEADLWKLILEDGLEDLLGKFYIEVPEKPNSWKYIHFLVNEDYEWERPEFDLREKFEDKKVFLIWYRDQEGFNAEAEFDEAVRIAKL